MKTTNLIYSLTIILFTLTQGNSQVGIGTTNPDNSSILDLTSQDKGFLFPRLTLTERNAIVSPAKGLTIFNLTENVLQVNTGTPSQPVWSIAGSVPPPTYSASNGVTMINNNFSLGGSLVNPVTEVNQLDKRLSFLTTSVNGFSVNSGQTLSIDGLNHRVGIGTSSPTNMLVVNANAGGSSLGTGLQLISGASNGFELVSDANGNAYWRRKTQVTSWQINFSSVNVIPGGFINGASFFLSNEIGMTSPNSNTLSIPAGRYIVTIIGDMSGIEIGNISMRTAQNSPPLFFSTYTESLGGNSIFFETNSTISVSPYIFCQAISGFNQSLTNGGSFRFTFLRLE